MKYAGFLVAFLAVCILMMPAFSVQDNGYPMSGQYDQQKSCDCQKPFDCQKSPCGEDGKQIGPKSMMGDGKKIICECKVLGKDCNQKPCDDQKSMMGDQGQYDQQKSCDCQKPFDCQKSQYGEDGKKIEPKSMMGDGKKIVCECEVLGKDCNQKPCDDQKSMMGDQGQYDQQKSCDCQKSQYGEDGKQIGPKSMMGDGKKIVCECEVLGKDCNQKPCDDQKSMMGDQGQYDQQKSCDCQKPCDCQKSQYGEDGKQIEPKSMMGDGKKIVCECKVLGKDCHQMPYDDQKSMMGDQGQYDQQNTWNDSQKATTENTSG